MSESLKKISSILYVEDEKYAREELEEFLHLFCDHLYVAQDGAEGLELYKKHHPQIVITDIKMPQMNGIDMACEIGKLNSEVELIFTTAFRDSDYMHRAIQLHATDYVVKPVDLDVLTKILQKTIKVLQLKADLEKKNRTIEEYLKIVDENVLISSTDLEGVITYVSEAFCRASGYTKEELMGVSHSIVRHEDVPMEIYKHMWKTITKDKKWEGEIKNKRKDGSSYWVSMQIYPIYDENKIKTGYTAIRQDITYLTKVQELSIRDALTGLYNRRYFNERFGQFIKSSKRSNEIICFCIIDVDHFKQYNDTYGHQMGDEALIAAAHSMQKSLLRAEDMLFRLGGEEFGVLFKAPDEEKAVSFINKLIQNVYALEIPHRNNSAGEFLSVSAGLAIAYAESVINENSFYKRADDLLYEAKESGRNRVVADKKLTK